ncbi:wall-associated receptor kinase 3-like [Cryptomeria japonica]|uniref:wall-associated receptor kinase 3-like n=1 Tax=Cryptomeria japonica TaxID=3369 RepID=UPI0027DA70D3|nr:wall-associated receptor kinase 3-like [Cryptomeria japonica]
MAPLFTAYVGNFGRNHLSAHGYKIMEIDYKGHLVINASSIRAYSCNTSISASSLFQLPLGGPFTISMSNKFVVIGCKSFGTYGSDWGGASCISSCSAASLSNSPYCRYGCCEVTLQNNYVWLNITGGGAYRLFNSTTKKKDRKCGFSTILDPSTFTIVDNKTNLFWDDGEKAYFGLRLNWGIGQKNCSADRATTEYSCSSNAECIDSPTRTGHVCKCPLGYEGNGYVNGTHCTDIDECSNKSLNACVEPSKGGVCHNLEGSYNCSCAKGYTGDGFQDRLRCDSESSNHGAFPAIAGSVSSFVVVSLAASLLIWWLKKRHLKLVEAKYFQQLQQYITSRVGRESLRMFSAKELARASNYYSSEMVLGSGGFGTVFKGILLDGTLVAIKKSKQAFSLEDGHDFLNEVAILSQINHRNIVKLLGCCIQTKFPMLVSEFVPNGTLFEHLQSKEECLPWASRLHIAIETAEALAYLHSGASQPIFHRDVKSSNILLNETFSPKVADFGISRLISASNNTHLTTNIMGTRGYLDPEYFQTYQLTDKSDVYSFGVVLVELITGLKPLSAERISEEWSLSTLFLNRINHNRLREILDSKVLEEETLQQMEDIARLARECLYLERRKRPSMKEVVEELLWVRGGARKRKVPNSINWDGAIFEQTSICQEDSQTSYKFRSYTFPSAIESTSEEPLNALIEMSTLPK